MYTILFLIFSSIVIMILIEWCVDIISDAFGKEKNQISKVNKKSKIVINDVSTNDLNTFMYEIINDSSLFPTRISLIPRIIWSDRVVNSYWGIAYIRKIDPVIRINKRLQSLVISNKIQVLKYLIYHEVLHFEIPNHSPAFKKRLFQYPNAEQLEIIIDNL